MSGSKLNRLRRISLTVLPFLAPLVGVLYGLGDQQNWWDGIRGRSACLSAYSRLASPAGFPYSWIYRGESDFGAIEKLLVSRSTNEAVRDVSRSGKEFVLITRGDVSIPLKARVPPDYPDPTFVPDTSPVLLVTGLVKRNKSIEDGVAYYASSLGEIRRWIDDQRNADRYWVTTFLVAILSIVVLILGKARQRDDAAGPAQVAKIAPQKKR